MDKDIFHINFPENISLETKALLMGATMLVVNITFFFIRNYSQILLYVFDIYSHLGFYVFQQNTFCWSQLMILTKVIN